MKKILKLSTALFKTGFAAKDMLGTVLHPLAAVRNFVKKIIIKSIVAVIKQAISLATKDKAGVNNHILIRQLSALGSSNVDMTGLQKNLQFKMNLDSLLEQADENDVYKIFNFVNLSGIKNKMAVYKNSLRTDAYEYITENNFESLKGLVERVNDVLKMPTQIVGCEFAKCTVTVESHDEINKDFVLVFDVSFAVKSC